MLARQSIEAETNGCLQYWLSCSCSFLQPGLQLTLSLLQPCLCPSFTIFVDSLCYYCPSMKPNSQPTILQYKVKWIWFNFKTFNVLSRKSFIVLGIKFQNLWKEKVLRYRKYTPFWLQKYKFFRGVFTSAFRLYRGSFLWIRWTGVCFLRWSTLFGQV